MTEKANDRKSLCMLISAMLIFGTIGVLRRYIPLPSALLVFLRGVLGSSFLFVFAKATKKGFDTKLPLNIFLRLAFTGAMIGVNWILLFEAYRNTTVAVVSLCYYMEPTIVMLLSPVIFKERLTLKKSLCAAAAVIGMVFVSGVLGDSGGQSGNFRGVLLGLCAAVFYSAIVIMNKKTPGINAYQRVTIQLFSAGIVMLPYLLLTNGFGSVEFSASAVMLTVILGIFHTGIAYALYFGSLEGLRVQTIAVFSYIDPVSALLFSSFLLREPLSTLGVAGAVMIIGSALISEIERK